MMNRHKSNWSAMGYSKQTEPSQQEIRTNKNIEILKEMIAIDGFDYVVTLLRKVYNENI